MSTPVIARPGGPVIRVECEYPEGCTWKGSAITEQEAALGVVEHWTYAHPETPMDEQIGSVIACREPLLIGVHA